MKLQSFVRGAFTISALLVFQVNSVGYAGKLRPQEGALLRHKVLSRETYARVLDIVFPRDEGDRGYDLVLRFEPTFAPESQIVIRRAADKAEILEYASLSGNIYAKLDSLMAHGGKEDAVAMAKLIQVRKRLIEVPAAQISAWHSSLAGSIRASIKTLEQRSDATARGTGTVTLDGTFYDLSYDQVGSHISFNVLDHEVSDREVTGALQLVRWMNVVRRDVERLIRKQLRDGSGLKYCLC